MGKKPMEDNYFVDATRYKTIQAGHKSYNQNPSIEPYV